LTLPLFLDFMLFPDLLLSFSASVLVSGFRFGPVFSSQIKKPPGLGGSILKFWVFLFPTSGVLFLRSWKKAFFFLKRGPQAGPQSSLVLA
jgi:hypothetical protein